MGTRRWRWRRVLLPAAIAGGMLLGGWHYSELRRDRKVLAEIQGELDEGRHGTAVRKLLSLLARRPDSDEALYLLGDCEMRRGRAEAADKAWARVPPGSPSAPRAILGRVQLRAGLGRLAEAEDVIRDALADPRIDGTGLALSLGPIYCQQGRLEETLRLIEARWDALNRAGEGDSESAIYLIRGYIERRRSPIPADVIRSDLDPAGRSNPDDDRVWLGKANLAIRIGSYREAERWIDACLRRRPEDVPVWRARLEWAIATSRVAEAQEAMKHIPAGESDPARIWRLAAWLAARRRDVASERAALERLIAADPTDSAGFDRLAELAVQEGRPARGDEYRRRKAEIDRLEARYETLYRRNQPMRDAEEMAHLAEQLGRRFEARAFLTLAIGANPGRDDLRRGLDRPDGGAPNIEQPGRTLSDLVVTALELPGGVSLSAAGDSSPREDSSSPGPVPRNLARTGRKGEPE